jgi:hypothetical protein
MRFPSPMSVCGLLMGLGFSLAVFGKWQDLHWAMYLGLIIGVSGCIGMKNLNFAGWLPQENRDQKELRALADALTLTVGILLGAGIGIWIHAGEPEWGPHARWFILAGVVVGFIHAGVVPIFGGSLSRLISMGGMLLDFGSMFLAGILLGIGVGMIMHTEDPESSGYAIVFILAGLGLGGALAVGVFRSLSGQAEPTAEQPPSGTRVGPPHRTLLITVAGAATLIVLFTRVPVYSDIVYFLRSHDTRATVTKVEQRGKNVRIDYQFTEPSGTARSGHDTVVWYSPPKDWVAHPTGTVTIQYIPGADESRLSPSVAHWLDYAIIPLLGIFLVLIFWRATRQVDPAATVARTVSSAVEH